MATAPTRLSTHPSVEPLSGPTTAMLSSAGPTTRPCTASGTVHASGHGRGLKIEPVGAQAAADKYIASGRGDDSSSSDDDIARDATVLHDTGSGDLSEDANADAEDNAAGPWDLDRVLRFLNRQAPRLYIDVSTPLASSAFTSQAWQGLFSKSWTQNIFFGFTFILAFQGVATAIMNWDCKDSDGVPHPEYWWRSWPLWCVRVPFIVFATPAAINIIRLSRAGKHGSVLRYGWQLPMLPCAVSILTIATTFFFLEPTLTDEERVATCAIDATYTDLRARLSSWMTIGIMMSAIVVSTFFGAKGFWMGVFTTAVTLIVVDIMFPSSLLIDIIYKLIYCSFLGFLLYLFGEYSREYCLLVLHRAV